MSLENKTRAHLITTFIKHLEKLIDFDVLSKYNDISYQTTDTGQLNLYTIKECIACTNKNVSQCIESRAIELVNNEVHSSYETHTHFLSTFYVTTGCVISTTSLIGICFNMIGIYLLSIPSNRKTLLNILLLALLGFETIFLVFRILRSLEKHLNKIQPKYLKLFHIFVSCGIRFSLSITILMVIVMARSRFYRVVDEIERKRLLTNKQGLRLSVITNIVPIIIISLVVTIPIPWEIDIEDETRHLIPSDLRLNRYYFVLYFGTLHLGILGALPLCCLLYYNYKLVILIMRNNINLQQNSVVANENTNMIRVLGGIIFSFLFLHSLRLIITLGEFSMLLTSNINNEKWCLKRGYGIPFWLEIALSVNKLLKVLHSSLNVLIYLCLNWKELIEEWPPCAPKFLKNNNNANNNPQRVAVLLGVFNLSTLMAFTVTNKNRQSIKDWKDKTEFELRKCGSEYL